MLKIKIISEKTFKRLARQIGINEDSEAYSAIFDVLVNGESIGSAALKHRISKQMVYITFRKFENVTVQLTDFEKAMMDRFHPDQWADLAEEYL